MIQINALSVLFLVEMLVIFAGLIAFLVYRGKKIVVIHRESVRQLGQAQAAQEELQKQVVKLKAGAASQAAKTPPPAGDQKDLDACKMEITILEGKLKEKTKLLIDLQERFDGVEKEYLLLYQKHQAEQPDI
jgi:flagellar motility protein MotE (MotC chaperone)